jgi:hypothetical protein
MKKTWRTLLSIGAAAGALFATSDAKAASAAHAVVFVHGTGDYPGTLSCSGTPGTTGYYCAVANAVNNYWTQAEIDAVRGGRPYLVTGFHGGTATPWKNGSPYNNNAYNGFPYGTPSGCSTGEANCGTAYEVAHQIQTFLNNDTSITQLEVVSHSGGSNVMRYILQHSTLTSEFANVAAKVAAVEAIASPSRGTYLADRVFANDGNLLTLAGSALASLMGFKDDGTYFIQTANMKSQNTSSSYFGVSGMSSSQGGVPFYASGGLSTTKCFGVTLWGHCLGVTAGSLGGSNCDSALMDTGLAALHNFYLNTNDDSTARNSCSDGFISCASSQAIGTQFGFSVNQDHNQSRRTCNNEASKIASEISGVVSGFDLVAYSASDLPVSQWDACGFSTSGSVTAGSKTVGYAVGCPTSYLGDGYCDWDCEAMYGHDAPATFDSSGRVTSWGSTDDCTGVLATGSAPQGFSSTNNPWAADGYYGGEPGTYTQDGVNWSPTTFTGLTHANDSTVWFTDPNAGGLNSAGRCPQSWIGDGVCDECVLAQYGNDGNDCLPGKVAQCSGMLAKYSPYGSNTNNPIYNELAPKSTNGSVDVDFNVTNTNSATQNTQNAVIKVAKAGDTIWAGTDSSSYCSVGDSTSSGDTYLNLYDSNGNLVASNDDDSCSTASELSYTASSAGVYTLKIGCYQSGSCSGTASYYTTGEARWAKVVQTCTSSSQCPSGVSCDNGICASNIGNGTCDIGECARNNWSPCSVDSDCSTGTCSGGYCADSASTCNTSSDCTGGATCWYGGCTFATSDCTMTTAAGVTQSLCR